MFVSSPTNRTVSPARLHHIAERVFQGKLGNPRRTVCGGCGPWLQGRCLETRYLMAGNRSLWRFLGVALVTIGVLVTLRPRLSEFLVVESCLDHGGSYDYAKGWCDHAKNHPYVPWSALARRYSHVAGLSVRPWRCVRLGVRRIAH